MDDSTLQYFGFGVDDDIHSMSDDDDAEPKDNLEFADNVRVKDEERGIIKEQILNHQLDHHAPQFVPNRKVQKNVQSTGQSGRGNNKFKGKYKNEKRPANRSNDVRNRRDKKNIQM